MKSVISCINEKLNAQKWVAISVTTRSTNGWDYGKQSTSERVVSYETYQNLKQGKTKGYREVVSVETLGPVCSTKLKAMDFLTPKETNKRKSDIDKGDADYIVYCISSGKFNPSGKTSFDFSIWEDNYELYYDSRRRSILFGAPGSLKEGDMIYCVDNDTNKKLSGAPKRIDMVCKCDLDEFRKKFREKYPNLCKSPKYAFGKVSDGLPWSSMGQMYSIKGIA